ncbi:MAG: TonB-dependent receptor [Acidobacteria bacterium]|nr:TonB-dependent receptor [Acidobacteriota bacterium]
MHHVAFAALFLLPSLSLYGQNAQITGRISDSLQAVITEAEISATNTATQVTRRTVSNERGLYTIPSLPPGMYQITVAKPGFRSETRTNLQLIVDQTATMDFELQVGGVTEKIEVNAQAALLDEQTSSLGQLIDNTKIQNIPLNGRSAFRLVQLTPGILSTRAASGQFGDIPVNTTWDTNFSINGGRAQSNEIQIDGVPATTGFFNQITTIPSIESTQEFKVQSNNLSAEWGRFGGGVLNVSTRSGTNEFHGALFEFLRNSAFDSNELFNKTSGRLKPPFRMNQYGAAIGGPIVRNRTFFFGDYQGTKWRRGDVFRSSLPTNLERSGDYSQTLGPTGALATIYDPLSSPTARTPFAANRLPVSRISPIAQKMLAYYPQPNVQGDLYTNFNNFISNAGRLIDSDQFSAKIDHQFSDKWRTFGRIARNKTSLTQPDYFGNVATSGNGSVGTTPFTQHTAALDNTVILNSTTVLSIRYGFARWYQLRQTRSYGFDQRELGLPASLVSQFQIPVFPAVTVEQYAGLGGQSYLDNGNDTHSLLGSVTKTRGRHNLKFGGDVRLKRINYFNLGSGGGAYTFNRVFTRGPNPNLFTNTGNGVASLLLGVPASGNVPTTVGVAMQNYYAGFYLQDDIRLTSKLTMNIGLRYETESPYTERYNQINSFNIDLTSPVRNPAFPNLTGGLEFASKERRTVHDWDKLNFAPRIGFAYALGNKTVLRWGAGLFFSPLDISNNAVGFSPSDGYSATTPLVASLDNGITPFRTLADPYPDGLVAPTRNSLGSSTFLGQAPAVWDSHPILGENYQWNFDLQRQLPWNLVADVSYAGSRGIHLAFRNREMNALDPQYLALNTGLNTLVDNPFAGRINVGTLSQPRVARRQLLLPFPQYTGLNIINMTMANSVYHSLQAKVERRFSHGISMLMAYTAGKVITDAASQVSPIGPTSLGNVQNWYNLRAERGLSDMDVAQSLTVSFVAELPFGPGKALGSSLKGAAAQVVGGWQLNGVSSYTGGTPLTLSAPIPGGGNRPNSTGVSARIDSSRSRGDQIERWFDTSQFTLPASFSLGNVGRTLPDVRGPSIVNTDLSLIKNTKLKEGVSLQFRLEYFNLFNRANLDLPNTGFGSGQFGKITATVGLPRVGQMALKLNF